MSHYYVQQNRFHPNMFLSYRDRYRLNDQINSRFPPSLAGKHTFYRCFIYFRVIYVCIIHPYPQSTESLQTSYSPLNLRIHTYIFNLRSIRNDTMNNSTNSITCQNIISTKRCRQYAIIISERVSMTTIVIDPSLSIKPRSLACQL